MGVFYYSKIKKSTTPEEMSKILFELSQEIWGGKYQIARTLGIPITPEDNREAKWEFWIPDWTTDCAFTISLIKGGKRMEFKVPRSQFDQWWKDQQQIRRKLIRRFA